MLQEDPKSDTSFDKMNKATLETGSVSGSTFSKQATNVMNPPTGNLLSNVQPPSILPDFTLWNSPATVGDTKNNVSLPVSSEPIQSQPTLLASNSVSQGTVAQVSPVIQALQNISVSMDPQPLLPNNQFPSTEFSAAIPPSKGFQHVPTKSQTENETTSSSSGGIMDFFKEALPTGVLSKVAKKAKSSVDSIITTLDPQMSEYIYSGGDTEVTVTSENEEEVSAVRNAFHSVFGKAWVNGIQLNMPPQNMQAVSFEMAIKNAEEKIDYSFKYRRTPTVAVESILLKQNENWYDLSVLVLKDTEKQITIQTFSQATPVPADEFLKIIEKEWPDLKDLNTEERLATYLNFVPKWQFHVSGLTRKEVILLAAKTLVKIYKDKLASH